MQFRDGRIARAPLALCEVQGYAYEAAMGGAELVDAFGQEGADRWREFAVGLSERFRARFWVDDADGAYPAMALEDGRDGRRFAQLEHRPPAGYRAAQPAGE